MRTEKGVVIAAYKQNRRNPRYTVLKRKKNWEGWELPKGHLEDGDYEKTVLQELEEEAGIEEDRVKAIEDMEKLIEWSYKDDGEKVKREYKAFLVELDKDTYIDTSSNPHDEHETGLFLRFKDVEDMLTYEQHVEVLKKAHEKVSQE